jgi:signal transduction histidine kinase
MTAVKALRRLAVAAAIVLGLGFAAAPAWADDKPTPEQAKAITLKAAALISAEGIEAAKLKFHADGEFKTGEIYVNVIDLNGTWLIYPLNPKNEGKSVLNVKDADGKLLVREIIRTAQDQGEGWVEYRWLNPVSNKIEPKMSFVKMIADKNVIAYVGIYR